MLDIVLESVRAATLIGIVGYLWCVGRKNYDPTQKGWNLIVSGFGLLLFGSLLDISDNFESLNFLVVIGDTEVESLLEKFFGFLGGFVLIAVGLVLWIPSVQRLNSEISERRQAEEALVKSRDQLRLVTDNLPVLIAYIDAESRYCFANKIASQWLARPVEEIIGRTVSELLGQEYEKIRARIGITLAGEQQTYVDSITYPDEVMRTIRVTHVPHFGVTGSVEGYFTLVEDITEFQQTEQALRERDERFRAIADHSPSAIFLKDTGGHYIFANRVWHDIYNPTGADIIGKTVHDILPPDIAKAMLEVEAKVLETGVPVVGELLVPAAGDGWQNILSSKFPVRNGDGNIIALGVINTDITERAAAERSLRDSEAHLAHAQRIAKMGSWVWERDTDKVTWSDALYQLLQIDPEAGTDPIDAFYARIHPDDRVGVAQVREQLKQSGHHQLVPYRIILPDGEERHLQTQWMAEHDASGKPVRAIGITQDVTEALQAEGALRQAQKMEAAGQLTGGVAHDFNNMLAVILGNSQLLRRKIGASKQLAAIERAGQRAAELTQRLLAFSRKQTLQPQSIDLAELIPGLHDLLHRTLGEPVKIVTDVPEELWPVTADPGQLENALLNLSINARDAMPDGGILEIECSNIELQEGDMRVSNEVAAGDYVQIVVRDTGTGMPKDVLERVFEPFYTTKDVGDGTGLGLSMVLGFTRQSGGDAVIESEPGKGTEVKLLLPRAEATVAADEPKQEAELKRGQDQSILVLEDDPDVRSFAVDALEGLGYRVLEAADANAAMRVLEEASDTIDLLLSDVVLPGGVSGPEFAAKAKDLYPKLKIVFMSGYAAGHNTQTNIPDFDETLLAKPFELAGLAGVMHDALAA